MRPGDVIAGKYELERKLGQGGAGVVWTAKQLGLGRSVALKLLHSDRGGVDPERVAREARAVGRLEHDNCVKLFDFGRTDDGLPFLVFEQLEGQSLDALRGARLQWRRAVQIMTQVAAAIDYAHANGVVHRDIKPGNIFQANHRGRDVIKVLDFGLAKLDEPSDLTGSGAMLGTILYTSPEQLRAAGDVTPATDLYSIGAVLFELLEGHPPFDGESALEVGRAHLTQPAPPLEHATCPDAMHKLVARLLAKDPLARPSAAELCDAFDTLLRPPKAEDPFPTRWLAVAGVVMMLAAAVGLFVLLNAEL